MKNNIRRILFLATLLGLDYISYQLHTVNSSTSSRLMEESIELIHSESQNEIQNAVNEFKSEDKLLEKSVHLAYLLDGTMVLFIIGLFIDTSARKS